MSAPDIYDPAYVKGVFDRCSERYIAFSFVCSMGFTRKWRKQCVEALTLTGKEREGYDLMAGTGEVWPHLLAAAPAIETITAVDISSGMHRLAMERLHAMRSDKIAFVQDDVLASNLPDDSADFVVSTFGLKTFNKAQHQQLAQLIARVLRPGARFSLIEASDPKGWFLRPLYLFHLQAVLPLIERFLMRGAQDFAMIGTYSTNFQNASALGRMLEDQGLIVEFRKHFFGCATSVSGQKPPAG